MPTPLKIFAEQQVITDTGKFKIKNAVVFAKTL